MSDVFISYKKEDAGRVIRLVEALRAEGLSVWWDHGIAPGAQWDQTIQNELNAAKVVIAIWSNASVAAPWVKEEANVGKNRGILLPVMIDKVDPPLGFGLIQAADLVGWSGDKNDAHWVFVVSSIKAILAGKTSAGIEAPGRRKSNAMPMIIAGAAVVLVALGVGGMTLLKHGRGAASVDASGPSISASVSGGTTGVEAGVVAASANAGAPAARISPAVTFRRDLSNFSSVAFAPNGKFVVTGDQEGVVRTFDAADGRKIGEFSLHKGPVTAIAFSPDGRLLATASQDKSLLISLWPAMSEYTRFTFPDWVNSARFTADGEGIAAVSADGTARLYGLRSKSVYVDENWGKGGLFDAAPKPDATASAGQIALVGTNARAVIAAFATNASPDSAPDFDTDETALKTALWSKDGSSLILAGATQGLLARFDAKTHAALAEYKGHTGAILAAALSRDGARLVSSGADKTVRVWDVESGKEEARFALDEPSQYVAFAPDGRTVLAGTKDGGAGLFALK